MDRITPQVSAVAISGNGDPARFAAVAPGIPVLPDPVPGHPGPLAGLLAGLDHALASGFDWVLTVPGDAPLVPPDLAARLDAARRGGGTPAAYAASGGQAHPPVGLWSTALRDDLRAALEGGERRVARWAKPHAAVAEWPATPLDPFLNLNTPAEVAAAEALLRGD
ncbi:molybdenum cofactor guanylyltransferase [Roseomonas sp. CCTCC AB2023176]|uniref:molybdenum cofactor guanylyltransferase n=1 Tax=Roseomonas sp. CCTCC AB2023176 TaxID=3342640 RepID=UPI0035D9C8AF